MPQSQSPTSTTSKGSDDNIPSNTRMSMSEAALRKKKNADAQAAFRARRANYIATLEETGACLSLIVICPAHTRAYLERHFQLPTSKRWSSSSRTHARMLRARLLSFVLKITVCV